MQNYLNTKYDLNDSSLVSVIDELPFWSAPFGMELLNAIELKKNINVLDIGSGLGFPLLEVAMRLGDSCKIYGIDPWQTAIERIKEKIDIYGIRNVNIIEGNAENIPLEDNSIDLIISNNGLNNVQDLNKSLSECSRILKKDAPIIFTMNLNTSFREFYKVYIDILIDNDLYAEVEKLQQHIYSKRKPIDEIINLLINNNIRVINYKENNFIIKCLDGTTFFNHFLIKLAFLPSWMDIVEIKKQKLIFSQLEDTLNKKAEDGELTFSVPFVTFQCGKI